MCLIFDSLIRRQIEIYCSEIELKPEIDTQKTYGLNSEIHDLIICYNTYDQHNQFDRIRWSIFND